MRSDNDTEDDDDDGDHEEMPEKQERQKLTTLPNATEDMRQYGPIRRRMQFSQTPTVRNWVRTWNHHQNDLT